MLKVDLAQLERRRRVPVDAQIEPDALAAGRDDVTFAEPVIVRLEAQMAGSDVVVRGSIEAEVELACRRCLNVVRRRLEEEVTFLYREDAEEADAEEVYPLPAGASELDLLPAVREYLLLAAPPYVVCDETCQGFCPSCGVNRNEAPCTCESTELDERWAALRRLKSE
jgi:uncharacterized protein